MVAVIAHVRRYKSSGLALMSGTRLGVYEVTAPIGEGGMGRSIARTIRS
jgi:hypothetical protein